jgi:Na+/citrate or Na+/malate symporter
MGSPERPRPPGSLVAAMNWMGGLSLLLFWLPVVGPLIAGCVGGVKAGTLRRAIIAVFLPAVLTGALAAAGVSYLADWYPWGLLAGLGGIVLCLLNVVPLLAGAVVGGALAPLLQR